MHWTSVDDAMPKEGVTVLVCVRYDIGVGHELVGMETAMVDKVPMGSGCLAEQWVKVGGPSLVHGKGVWVTHWMSLPSYPGS